MHMTIPLNSGAGSDWRRREVRRMNFSVADIAVVVRLVREACDLWDTPHAWREHLLLGACELLQGSVGSMHAVDSRGDRHRVHTLAVVEKSKTETAIADFSGELLTDSKISEIEFRVMPEFNSLYGAFEEVGWATMSRRQSTEEAPLFACPKYNEFCTTRDCNFYLVSLRNVDVPQRTGLIEIARPHGSGPFDSREVALLELLHSEIAPLIGVRLTTEKHLSRDGLSRRLNQTLDLLLEGCSEKEAALKLKISPRTLHDYVTMLYQHFSVTSRAELLAYFIRRRPENRVVPPNRCTES